jgi:outer membrane immunogenic protein
VLEETKTLTGWTIGAGIEYRFAPAWSIRGEYLYTDFGDQTYFSGAPWQSTAHSTSNTVQLGLSYYFGGPL